MLTTSLRPFHVLDSALASELDDLFFDAVDAIAVPSNGGVPDAMLFDDTTNAIPSPREKRTPTRGNERNEQRDADTNERSRRVQQRRDRDRTRQRHPAIEGCFDFE